MFAPWSAPGDDCLRRGASVGIASSQTHWRPLLLSTAPVCPCRLSPPPPSQRSPATHPAHVSCTSGCASRSATTPSAPLHMDRPSRRLQSLGHAATTDQRTSLLSPGYRTGRGHRSRYSLLCSTTVSRLHAPKLWCSFARRH